MKAAPPPEYVLARSVLLEVFRILAARREVSHPADPTHQVGQIGGMDRGWIERQACLADYSARSWVSLATW